MSKAMKILTNCRNGGQKRAGGLSLDEAIAELEAMEGQLKPKMCEQCDNNHKDRTIFYDGKKILMCTLCKHNAVSYFKPKDDE